MAFKGTSLSESESILGALACCDVRRRLFCCKISKCCLRGKWEAHKWLVVFVRATGVLVAFAVCDAAARFALRIGISVGGWRIYVHIVDGPHPDRNSRLDMAIGGNLFVHGFIFGLCDAIV